MKHLSVSKVTSNHGDYVRLEVRNPPSGLSNGRSILKLEMSLEEFARFLLGQTVVVTEPGDETAPPADPPEFPVYHDAQGNEHAEF